jgi:hypothetical protein
MGREGGRNLRKKPKEGLKSKEAVTSCKKVIRSRFE